MLEEESPDLTQLRKYEGQGIDVKKAFRTSLYDTLPSFPSQRA